MEMSEFLKIILSLSVSGTLLVLLILGLDRFGRKRFSRRWQYYIWIAAVLRFLLPIAPETTLVGSTVRSDCISGRAWNCHRTR